MKLTVAGTGYVGIVTGTGFANLGNDVICYDVDAEKITTLSSGRLAIYEPGLGEVFQRNLEAGRLHFSTDPMKAVQESDIFFICVGTPSNSDRAADLTAVKDVARAVGRYMNGYKVIVNKSTVPVGTADLVKKIVEENQPEKIPFDVVSNPEFLREWAQRYFPKADQESLAMTEQMIASYGRRKEKFKKQAILVYNNFLQLIERKDRECCASR